MAKTNIRTIKNYIGNILKWEIIDKTNMAFQSKTLSGTNLEYSLYIRVPKKSSNIQFELQIIYASKNTCNTFLNFITKIINQYTSSNKQFTNNGNITSINYNNITRQVTSYTMELTRLEAEFIYTLFKLTNRVME